LDVSSGEGGERDWEFEARIVFVCLLPKLTNRVHSRGVPFVEVLLRYLVLAVSTVLGYFTDEKIA